MPITFRSKIPNHPNTCLGVSGPVWDESQCRLCWLAAYDGGYRRSWGIDLIDSIPLISDEDQYPCIHRGTEKFQIPGCGGCGGNPLFHECKNPKVIGKCIPHGTPTLLQGARAKGILVCSECGFREHEPDYEMLPSQFRYLMSQPPSEMPEGWEDWKVTKVAYRDEFKERCEASYDYPRHFRGRGIVIGAGGEKYFSCAYTVAYFLRKHGCRLPIQFWYLGPKELDPVMESVANSVGIECVDATSPSFPKPRILKTWEIKPFSVIHSPFEEVLYLDADCLPVKDPEYLFNEDAYQQKGAIFWPDIPPNGGRTYWLPPEVWKMFGLLPDTGPDFESGQFLINKARCWKELCVTMWLNEHSDFVYQYVHGDKSTYNLAWNGCARDYVIPTHPAGWYAPSILQYDLDGELIFQHACQGKEFLRNGFEIPSIVHRNYIQEAHAELMSKWSGKIYGHLPCDPTDLPTADTFLSVSHKGEPQGDITLKPNGVIEGALRGLKRWAIDSLTLILFDDGRVSQTLPYGGNGSWSNPLTSLTPRK